MAGRAQLPQGSAAPPPGPLPLSAAAGTKPRAARTLGLAPPLRVTVGAPVAAPAMAGRATTPPSSAAAGNAKPACKRAAAKPATAAMRVAKKAEWAGPVKPPPATLPRPPPPPPPAMPTAPPPPPIVDTLATPTSTNAGTLVAFDGMSASMDNEEFLNYTCASQFAQQEPSQEYAQHNEGFVGEEDVEGFVGEGVGEGDGEGFVGEGVGEGDGEGFVEPTPRRAVRGANFTQKEDEALCDAWKVIGIDPITGNEQLNSSFWERIHGHFKQFSNRPRTIVSLQHRWSTISTDCQKWSGCLAQVDNLNPSGTNAIDKVNIAQKLFMGKPKKKSGKVGEAFNLFHCWICLENDEKWKSHTTNDIPNKRKNHTSVGDGLVLDTDDEGSSSPTPLSVNAKRPEGRKKAKEMRAKGGENMYKESLDNMMAVRKELASERRALRTKEIEERRLAEERKVAAEERRAVAEERRAAAEEKLAEIEERKLANEEMVKSMENEQRIMFMDPSALDEKGRAYLEMCRDQILMARGFVRGNGGGGGNGDGGNGGGANGGGDI